MAITAFKYGNFLMNALRGAVNWEADTVKVALVADTYTPDQDNHDFWSDVVANEASGTGYTVGGATLASKTLAYDAATNTITLDGDNVTWADSTVAARYAVVYVQEGTAEASPLVGYVDFGEVKASDNGTFQVTWNANGIYTITVD